MPQPFADQFRSIPMSSNLGESLERARGFAREQGHRAVMLEHLLLAFTEDPDASAVLQVSNVDLVRLGTDVSGYLGRLLEDMRGETGGDPQTDPELLRVLHAAVQAAQQSRRRQIDGAIVLAAVVGDGKSPAAGLLKAHGLTFEEAIRALQKTSAKANAQARSKQFATPPVAPAPSPLASATSAVPPQSAPSEPADARLSEGIGQSVEEILAAARVRIQQRTAVSVGRADADKPPPPARDPAPSQLSSHRPDQPAVMPPAANPDELLGELQAPPAPPTAPAPPAADPSSASEAAGSPTRPNWAPPALAAQASPPGRPLQPPAQRAAAPFPQRPLQPGEGPARPPLPSRTGPAGMPPAPGFPARPLRAPWPGADESAAPNGALTDSPIPARRPGQRTGGQGGHGPLVETIPRRMRRGVPTLAQVRISRDRVDGLILLLMKGRGTTHRPDALVMRALSVRLHAPDGGFWIEATSPETQWVETSSAHHQDDQIGWRWTVTPQRRGRRRLVLVVAARTVGHDGIAAETSPPDRTIEVTVTGGRLRGIARWGGLLAALLLGAVLGRFGGEVWALGVAIVKRVIG